MNISACERSVIIKGLTVFSDLNHRILFFSVCFQASSHQNPVSEDMEGTFFFFTSVPQIHHETKSEQC